MFDKLLDWMKTWNMCGWLGFMMIVSLIGGIIASWLRAIFRMPEPTEPKDDESDDQQLSSLSSETPMRSCTQCGTPMTTDSPEGLCARCLLSVAMKDGPATTVDSSVTRDAIPGASAATIDIANAAEIARRLPQFEIIELLGRGGMGVVYKARQIELDRIVALKILPPADAASPGFVERFRREARSLAKLSHPNIVSVHDFGQTNGLFYFVMEFVDGLNLRQMILAQRLTAAEALAVVPKICDALQFAHEEGVVHRDIKPENILLDKRGRVKIADFGLAKLLRRAQSDLTLTQSGATLGTPRYMAPEQMDKPETVDHRADIYSLGVVFYEMLTGEVPMGRFSPPSKKVQIDVQLDEIVLHALERDVELRYQHASQMREDVERVTAKPAAGRAAAKALGWRKREQKSRIPVSMVVSCLVGVAGRLWPYSVVDPSFLGRVTQGERPPELGVVIDPNAFGDMAEYTPASKAGLIKGDTILSMSGRAVHIWGLDNPDRIWSQTHLGSAVNINVMRNGQKIELHTIRDPDPVVVCFYANWQFLAGFCFLLFAVFALLSRRPRFAWWRGIAATLLGLCLLVLLLILGTGTFLNQPAKELWNVYSRAYDYSPSTYGQKLAACAAALGLLLLGIFELRRASDAQTPDAGQPVKGSV